MLLLSLPNVSLAPSTVFLFGRCEENNVLDINYSNQVCWVLNQALECKFTSEITRPRCVIKPLI